MKRFFTAIRVIAAFVILSIGLPASAQTLFDSFADGNFTASPIWSGNTANWTIVANSDAAAGATGSNTLRLNGPATAQTDYLSSQIATWSTSQEWMFFIGRRAQAFTAANQAYFWLYANEATLTTATVDGYRIAIGDDSGGDELRLEYIVNGAVSATVITSSGSIANGLTDIGFLVRVARSAAGTWTLNTSALPSANGTGAIASDIPTVANTNISQGSNTNNSLVPSANGYIGVAALHSTGANAIISTEFDQIYFTAATNGPSAITDAATLITTSSAQLNGTVNPNGPSTDVNFEYGTSVSYGNTFAATQSPVTVSGAVSLGISSLTANTLYHFRVTANNTNGSANGNDNTFVTLAVVPSAPAVTNPSSSTLTVTLGADANPAGTEYAIHESTTNQYVQANGTLGAVAAWQTAATWSSVVVSSLTPNTTYTFEVKARNSINTETAFGSDASNTTLVNTSPLITLTGTLNPFVTVAGSPSYSQNYSVAGSFLTDNITLTAPSGFQITLDTNTTWVSSFSIAHVSGTVASTTVYVRFNPSAGGAASGNITHTSTGSNNPVMPVSGNATENEPGAQSSITTSSVTNVAMNVTLSGGTGSSRIVVVSLAPVTYVPVDGAASSGVNSNYSLAADQSGNRIVFDGPGNSFTITGLSANTLYYLAAYEYNGSGVTSNYLTLNPGTATATTFGNPPTSVGNLNPRAKLDTLNIAFTSGNGTNRLVIVAEGGAVSLTPSFGQVFTGVNSDFSLATDQGSNNRVVYDGSGNSVLVTGISRNTLYGIKVIEYNLSGAGRSYFITANGATTLTTADVMPYSSGTYSQNFNTLPSSGVVLSAMTGFGQGPYYLIAPPANASAMRGWQFANTLSGDASFITDNGSGTSGATYSYGATGNSDRALGFLASGSAVSTAGIVFTNSSSSQLYNVTVSFTGQQWRAGTSTVPNQLKIQYALGTSSVLGGTWIDIPALTYTSTVTGSNNPVDGYTNFVALNATFTIPANWSPGQLLTMRILDTDDSGNDHGLAVDNFNFTATPASAPLLQDSLITFNSVLTTSMGIGWTNGDGAARIVKINTSNSFSNPVDGTVYTANTVYSGSGEQVIYNGSGNSASVSGLSAGQLYYVRVFSYNGTGTSVTYALQTATDNPASQGTASANPPTKLVVLNVNNNDPIKINQPFSITVQAQDASNNPQNVTLNTTVSILLSVGSGLLSGITSGVMSAGSNTLTISGILYDTPEFGVELEADATGGNVLDPAFTGPLTVYDTATFVEFISTPVSAVAGVNAGLISTAVYRPDFSIDNFYSGTITLVKVSGPGVMSGTLSKPVVNGSADFNDIQFSQPGTYEITATSANLAPAANRTITVVLPVAMNELVIPKYFASKTTASANDARTPVVMCVSFDNLEASTVYNLSAGLGLTTDAATNMGAGNLWNGTAFSGSILNNAFTSDANGQSGPVWIAVQPTGNASRFAPGDVHNLRVALSTVPFGSGVTAQFVSTLTMTALDVPNTALTAAMTDDISFVTGKSDSCMSGRFAIAYSDASGTGQPLSVCGIVSAFYTNTSQSQLPATVNAVYLGTAAKGSFAFVVPVGANNPNGVRYIGIRNAANQLLNSISDADGIWPSGANTTTMARRAVVNITEADASMNTLTSLSVTATTNVSCFGLADGSATASAVSLSPSVNYLWTPGGNTNATATGLAAGNYSVLATDANGCAKNASTTITEPSQFTVTASNNGPTCAGTDIQLSSTGGVSWSWTGPNGFTSNLQNPVVTGTTLTSGGVYTVVATNAGGCTNSASTTVSMLNCACTTPVLSSVNTNVDCNGNSTGSIDLTVSGGQTPYTFVWSNGASVEDISLLPAGTYTVTVTENMGCTAVLTVQITQPPALVLSGIVQHPICNNGTNGSIDLTVTGGTTPYQFSWSNGAFTEDQAGLASGPYVVQVTDANSCTAVKPFTLNNPAPFTLSLVSKTDATCFGAANGSIDITANNNGATASSAPGLLISEYMANPPGTDSPFEWVELLATKDIDFSVTPYTVVFTNNGLASSNGWIAGGSTTYAFEITTGSITKGSVGYVGGSSLAPLGFNLLRVINTSTTGGDGFGNANSTGVLGNGGTCDGIAVFDMPRASVTNSTTPVDAIMFGTTQPIVAGGTAGYKLPVNDNYNGGFVQTTSFKAPEPPNGSSTAATGVFNFGAGTFTSARTWTNQVSFNNNNQSAISMVNGNSYLWSNGATTEDVSNLSSGLYTVTATNSAGCVSSPVLQVVIDQPAAIVPAASYNPIACNGGSTNITVSATGGVPPYSGTGVFPAFAGPYSFTVTDASGCTGVVSGTITEPDPLSITGFTPTTGDAGTVVTITGTGFSNVSSVLFSTGSPTVYNVIADVKDNTHPYFGLGSPHAYILNGAQGPELTFVRGITYTFNINTPGHPFVITKSPIGGAAHLADTTNHGVVNNYNSNGTMTFTPDALTPDTVYYGCGVHEYMGYRIKIVDNISSSFTVNSSTQITATAPVGVITGPIRIITDCDTIISSQNFVVNTLVQLNLKVLLQGFYDGGGMMRPALLNQGVSASTTVSDSITVELHDAVMPFGTAYSSKVALNTDGTTTANWPAAVSGNSYYIVITHRNHLQTWSKVPVSFGTVTSFDFSSVTAPRAGGGGSSQKTGLAPCCHKP